MTKPKKTVIFLSPRYYPAIGGVETHVWNLSQELLKLGFNVLIFTTQHDKNLVLKEKIQGVLIERLPFGKINKKLATWRWMWQRREELKKADIIHIHDIFWWYLPLKFWFFKKPVYTTFHGYEGNILPRWQAVYHRRLIEILSKKTMAIGEFIKKWYKQNPDCVSYGAIKPLVNKESSLTNRQKNTAVFLGRLESDTGVWEYLKFIKNLKEKIKLDIYGTGSLELSIKCWAKQHRLSVRFCGLTSDPNRVFLKSRLAFVSQYLSILNAMICKTLVVAIYKNSMKKDYLNLHPMAKHMIVVSSPEELASKINNLNPQQEQQMINTAYNWAKKQTWTKLTQEYLKMWGQANG